MGKKAKNNSHRIKTSHKKALIKRKVVYQHVDRNIADINKLITQSIAHPIQQEQPKIQLETITFDELRKLIDKPAQKKRTAKINIEDVPVLENLLKKWGTNYERMSKDIKLNKLQWTPRQIEKKHQAYNIMIEEQQQE